MANDKTGDDNSGDFDNSWWNRIHWRSSVRCFLGRHVGSCWTIIAVAIVMTIIVLASCQRTVVELEYIRCIETRTITSITSGDIIIQAPTDAGVVICPDNISSR